ncbi:Alpha/Beta hydrolase protein [Aspergillus cavernicola]|uniref:Alpha/Beta hydrolase protein n=1 Tax=Aspergillus cavernicola TaxID=176166 RepID=A0ABR4HKI9_9EURO
MLVALKLAVFAMTACASAEFPTVCDVACQSSFNQSLFVDSSGWVRPDVNLDTFYATPHNFSDYEVGDLIKWEDVSPKDVSTTWSIPSGLSLSRFYYVSADVDGTPLPATGYALVPYTNPLGHKKPFRVVVWAHGTAGFTPQCAPSNNKGLYYNWMAPFALAQQGYVVIAPDYAGQGSTIPKGFMYNAGIAHANDVSLAVAAARNAFPHQITHEWVVVGHSEGGLTSWRTAQREAIPSKAVGGFLGAVSIAPAMEIMSLVPWVIARANGGPLHEIFLPFMLQSISRLFPSFDIAKYVSSKVLDFSELALHGCLNVAVPLLAPLTATDMYLNGANYPSAPEVLEWDEKYHGKGAHKLGGPLLVFHGEGDFIIPHSNTARVFTEQCDDFPESQAEYQLLPGLDHDGVLQVSKAIYFPWIADRFDNEQVDRGCTRSVAQFAKDGFSTIEQAWVSAGQVLVQ